MNRVPRTVWALGVVSLLMDLSSEIIHALLPLFLTTTLPNEQELRMRLTDRLGSVADPCALDDQKKRNAA